MPGVLPVINAQAVESTVHDRPGAQLHECRPLPSSTARTTSTPTCPRATRSRSTTCRLCVDGWLDVGDAGAGQSASRIRRVHLEEDTAKLTHVEAGGEAYSLIDFNRSGVPLMEIVTEPDMHSADEVRQLPRQAAQPSCATWASAPATWKRAPCASRPTSRCGPWAPRRSATAWRSRTSTRFRAVLRCIEYEIERQTAILDARRRAWSRRRWAGTRLRGVTVSQRSKEEAHDYRYFPEPDLPPLELSRGVGGGASAPACPSCPTPSASAS